MNHDQSTTSGRDPDDDVGLSFPPPYVPEQRWEYRYHTEMGGSFHSTIEDMLNRLGWDGWEVCGFTTTEVGVHSRFCVMLKRPRRSDRLAARTR